MTLWVTLCTSQAAGAATTMAMIGDDQRRQQDLADDAVELGAVAGPLRPRPGPGPRRRGADEAAEQGVRRAGRQAEQPGEQVPEDAADQAGEDDEQHRLAAVRQQLGLGCAVLVLQVDHRVGDGEGDLHGEEGADEVEDRGESHGDLGLEGPGRDRRSHGVGGVVKAVREVEGQCGHDDKHERDVCCVHDSPVWGRRLDFTKATVGVHSLFTCHGRGCARRAVRMRR